MTVARAFFSLVALVGLGVGYGTLSPRIKADASVEKAGEQVRQTEQKIGEAVAESKKVAEEIDKDLATINTPGGREELTRRLGELTKQQHSLGRLVASLEKDAAAFDTARSENMTKYEEHVSQLQGDSYWKRRWMRRHEELYVESGKRLAEAKELITDGQMVLQRADDLQHVAELLTIERNMRAAMTDLQTQVEHVKSAAVSFSSGATTFLARISDAVSGGSREVAGS